MKGKRVCKFHGGRSSGAKTPEGLARCAAAKKTHGNETTAIREERSLASARLAALEEIGRSIKVITGPKTQGRKPKNAHRACPELCEILKFINGSKKYRLK